MPESIPVFGVADESLPRIVRKCAYVIAGGSAGRIATVRDSGKLFLPGGGIETGETPAQALHREVLEELGSEVVLREPVAAAVQHFVLENKSYEVHATFFLGEIGERTRQSCEHDLVWSQPDQLFHPYQAWAAGKALGRQCWPCCRRKAQR